MTTKTFNIKTASLADFNRELKRIASAKCRAKDEDAKKSFELEYNKIKQAKLKKFPSKKSYFSMTPDEIRELDLETTIKGIASLRSKRCIYPDQTDVVLEKEQLFIDHKTELQERAKFLELQAKYSA